MSASTQPSATTDRTVVAVLAEHAARWQAAVIRGQEEHLDVHRVQICYVERTRIERFRVSSASRPGEYHPVDVASDGVTPATASCGCPATGICKHMALAILRADLFPFPIAVQQGLDLYPKRGDYPAVGPLLFPRGTRVRIRVGPDQGAVGVVSQDWMPTRRRVDDPIQRACLGVFDLDEIELAPDRSSVPSTTPGVDLLLRMAVTP